MTPRPAAPARTARPVFFVLCVIAAGIVSLLLIAAGCVSPSASPAAEPGIPPGKYVFVDHHININGVPLNGSCSPGMNIDFPTYAFDKTTGVLMVSQYRPGSFGDDYRIVYGDGRSLSGAAGAGAGTRAKAVVSLPFTQNGLTIQSLAGDGTVTVTYQNETFRVSPGEARAVTSRVIEDRGPPLFTEPCTVEIITTDTIANAGLLDKNTIRGI
jgi:hypothetical protein